uniref:Uncharacterized protein n=1 Tax=Strongyloides papillosus TaxID=174720 RepID=A0A0N5CHE6_STREA
MNTTNINDPKNANRTVEVILQNSQTIMIDQDKQYATMDKIKNEELFSMNKTTEINKYGNDDKIFQLPHIGPTLDVTISKRNPTCTKKTINYPKDKTSRVGKSNEKNKIKNNTEENYKLLKYLSSTFSGENNINNLLKTSFLCKDGDTLKKAIELSQSYSSDDHYKFLNGKYLF